MKILWFSNGVLSKEGSKGSGSWLHAMRDLIAEDVDLVNITVGNVKTIVENSGNEIKEYILPQWKLNKGVPKKENIQRISEIVERENPDVIHIWGIEKYWALLFSRGYIKHPHVLLEMQGVAAGSSNAYYGGLTPIECKKLWSIKSMLIPRQRVVNQYRLMLRNAKYESELIPTFKNIATQSDWTRDQLSSICSEGTKFYHSLRPIRKDFYEAEKWKEPKNEAPIIYASFSYYVPFKGAHVLLKAIALLKNKYPNIVLRLAGPVFYGKSLLKGTDYGKFLSRVVDELDIRNNIHFCGGLGASQIVNEIHHADVVVNPSFVESYSAAAAEAIYLGAPTVLSYAGAMVNFSKEKPVALYYSPLDYRSLAARIETLLTDKEVRQQLQENGFDVMSKMCSPEKVKERQINTYRDIK